MADALVVIPTYNEIENIERLVRNTFALQRDFHILVVDDGSPDGTGAKIKDLQNTFKEELFIIEREKKMGLGTAYIAGFNWALERDYEYVFEMDADFSHNPNDLMRLYNACFKEGAEVAIGSRYVTGVNVVNWPMGRVLLSWGASKYVRLVTGLPVHDTTAGFMCYKKEVLQSLNLEKIKFVAYAFQIETKYKVFIRGWKIKEVPVVFTDRTKGQSKMSSGIISEAVFGVLKLRIKHLFKKLD